MTYIYLCQVRALGSVASCHVVPSNTQLTMVNWPVLGDGPYDTEPISHLLTGNFSRRRYHVPAGEAFVYFLSRSHAAPRTPFQVSYIAEGEW